MEEETIPPYSTVEIRHRYWNSGLYTYTYSSYGTHPDPNVTCIGRNDTYLVEVAPGAGAEKFAPLVYLHPTEYSWPMSASKFIEKSRLMWAHGAACANHTEAGTGNVRESALSFKRSGPYYHRPISANLCRHEGKRYYAGEFTRPRDDGEGRPHGEGRPDGLGMNEGFYLDLNNDFHYGTAPAAGSSSVYDRAPVYSQVKEDASGAATDEVAGDGEHPVTTYWFFYGYSSAIDRDLFAHEGDWEHVNVHLDEDGERPTQVDYFFHHDPADTYNFADVQKEGMHPVVYSAKSAHGSYPTAKDQEYCNPDHDWMCTTDRVGKGRQWRTWEDVKAVKMQPWYGFGGAWGRVGLHQRVDTTAPLGPSSYKDPFGGG